MAGRGGNCRKKGGLVAGQGRAPNRVPAGLQAVASLREVIFFVQPGPVVKKFLSLRRKSSPQGEVLPMVPQLSWIEQQPPELRAIVNMYVYPGKDVCAYICFTFSVLINSLCVFFMCGTDFQLWSNLLKKQKNRLFFAEMLSINLRKDGTYSVKLRVTHKRVTRKIEI